MANGREGNNNEPVVAIGFLTRSDLNVLGQGFRRHFAIVDTPQGFAELIQKLDEVGSNLP